MFTMDDRDVTRQPLRCQGQVLNKPKTAKQAFREGLKTARLRLAAHRGHYVTPEELGADVGVSGQTIRNYESGESEPNFEMVEKLAGVLGVSLNWPPFGERHVSIPEEPRQPLPIELQKPSTKRRKGSA